MLTLRRQLNFLKDACEYFKRKTGKSPVSRRLGSQRSHCHKLLSQACWNNLSRTQVWGRGLHPNHWYPVGSYRPAKYFFATVLGSKNLVWDCPVLKRPAVREWFSSEQHVDSRHASAASVTSQKRINLPSTNTAPGY